MARYYQSWRNSVGYVEHMLRFYFRRPDALVTEMSKPSQDAWFACHRVVCDLEPEAYRLVRERFGPEGIGQKHVRLSAEDRTALDETIRRVAIERGLADDVGR